MSKKFKFVLIFILMLFMCLFASCVSVKTQVQNITIWGTSPSDSLNLGEFEIVYYKTQGKTKIYEVLKSDADKFVEMMNGNEYFVTDFTLKECFLYKLYLSDGFGDGNVCKLFSFGGNYWVAKQVNVKYFYFCYLPGILRVGQTVDGNKFSVNTPTVIWADEREDEETDLPNKVLYSWDEIKKFFPDAKFDDANKRIYLAAESYTEGEGITYLIYDETESTITLSDYWEAAK